jgi:hypothetical protein
MCRIVYQKSYAIDMRSGDKEPQKTRLSDPPGRLDTGNLIFIRFGSCVYCAFFPRFGCYSLLVSVQ